MQKCSTKNNAEKIKQKNKMKKHKKIAHKIN